jgi:hypothetical protein
VRHGVAEIGPRNVADVDCRIGGIAENELGDVGEQALGELVGDRLLDDDPLGRDARLAGVQRRRRSRADCRFPASP